MTEKFRKIVRTPEEKAKELRKFVEKMQPVKYIEDISPGTKKSAYKMIAQGIGLTALGALKGAAWLAAGGSQFLLTLARWLTMDNEVLRRMEEKYANTKLKFDKDGIPSIGSVIKKKYPNTYAHLLWLILLTAVSVGGYYSGAAVLNRQNKTEKVKIKKNSIKFKDFKLDPKADESTWQQMVDAVHPYVLAHIISSEGFVEKAYDDNFGRGTLTIGSGFTIKDATHRNFAQKVLGRRLGNGSRISVRENQILVSEWLHETIYPKIKKAIKTPIDASLFVMLADGAYNKGPNTYLGDNSGHEIADAVNKRKSRETIANTFLNSFCGIKGTQWSGLANRFAVSALCYLGDVSEETILNSIAEVSYTLGQDLLIYNGKSKRARAKGVKRIDDIEQLLLTRKNRITKGSVQKQVRSYLPEEYVAVIESGYVMASDGGALKYTDYADKVSDDEKKTSKTDELNSKGEDLYFDGKYEKAIKKFEKAIKEDPKNYIAYSNLVISHYKLGEYQDGVDVVQSLIKSEIIGDMPDDIKGYMYYNAALCRMAIGDDASSQDDKRKNYNMAIENLKLAKRFSGMQYKKFSMALREKLNRISKTTRYENATKQIIKEDNDRLMKAKLMVQKSETMA